MSLSMQFGIGAAFITASSTVGNPPSPVGPPRILTIQSAEIDFDGKIERLMGQNKMPDDVAPSDIDLKFKMSAGRVGVDMYNLMFGETITTGYERPNVDEGPTAIPVSPYQITVTNSATFTEDLGVLNAATLQPFQKVASGPLAGQYTVASGVYTFSSADHTSGISVLISYLDTPASGGRTLSLQNHIQGYGPVVEIVVVASYSSAPSPTPLGVVRLRAARITKMGLPLKRNGYLITPIEGEYFPDASGKALDIFSGA